MLLSGSSFDRQVTPDTTSILVLAFISVGVTFAMQFGLSWFLWSNLPFHARGKNRTLDPFPPHLTPIWPAGPEQPEFSICRTNSLAQVICIIVFLFYILNAVPGMIKNTIIVLSSCKFVSEDVDGVTRIHYWRSASFWAATCRRARTPFAMEMIDREVLQYYEKRKYRFPRDPRAQFFLPLSPASTPFFWTLDDFFPIYGAGAGPEPGLATLCAKPDWVNPNHEGHYGEQDTRLLYELDECRAFIRRKLAAINPETFAVEDGDDDAQDEARRCALAEHAANLGFGCDDGMTKEERRILGGMGLRRLKQLLEREQTAAKVQRTAEAANYLVCLDYCDGAEEREVKRVIQGYTAFYRSIVALVFGVLAEAAAMVMILICGIEYMLWSGSKVWSESNGMEEIILASLAIVFINEIDDAIYDHALPELYKTAHERDRFNVDHWVSSSERAQMEHDDQGPLFSRWCSWWPFGLFEFCPGGLDSVVYRCSLGFCRLNSRKRRPRRSGSQSGESRRVSVHRLSGDMTRYGANRGSPLVLRSPKHWAEYENVQSAIGDWQYNGEVVLKGKKSVKLCIL